MPAAKIIVKIGAEGGSLTVLGRKTTRGTWRFKASMVDESMLLLGEDDDVEVREASSAWEDSLAAVLTWLDKYPWARLHPTAVHPEFRREILEAVRSRLAHDSWDDRGSGDRKREQWERCGLD